MILGLLCRHRRLFIGRRRIHHGRIGKWRAVAGVVLMLDDWKDRWWSW